MKRRVEEHRAADPQAVRAAALALLGRREYASAELTAALVRKGYAAAVARSVVTECAAERLLDDTRYAESLVRMLAGRGQGPARIRLALSEAGLTDEQIHAALEGEQDWRALAMEVRRRKFGAALPRAWPERARQMRFLQYRGFCADDVARVLGGTIQEEDIPSAQ